MKRSIISIVLCVALLLSSMCAMFVMPASAAGVVDLLDGSYVIGGGGDGTATGTLDNGVLVVENTAAGELGVNLGEGVKLTETPFLEISVQNEVAFDISFYDGNNNKWFTLAADYYPAFGNGSSVSGIAPGSYENVQIKVTGAYTWDGSGHGNPVPANAAVTGMYIIPKAPGKITITKLCFTDGLSDISLNTASYNEADVWDAATDITLDAADWTAAANNAQLTSEIVLSNDADGNLVLGNTAGSYPAAYANVGATVPYADSAVYLDFTVTADGQTTVYLFFGDATETNFEGAGKGYYAVVGDVKAGNYSGYLYLKDMIAADSDLIDADGNVTVSVIKVFGSTSDVAATPCANAVTIREAAVLYNEAVVEPETYITYTANGYTHEGTIKAGDEITVDVTASAVADFAGFTFDVAFDDAAFEFVGYEWGETVAAMVADGAIEAVSDKADAVDGVKTVELGVMALEGYEVAEGAVIATITLAAKADITENFEIAINNPEVISYDSITNDYELVAEAANAIIEVIPSAYVMGDVNEDGEIDIYDAMRLFKFVNEEVEDLSDAAIAASDVNGDGEVDIYDAMRLFKFVNEEIDEL